MFTNTQNYYKSRLVSDRTGTIHGFSTRALGDMRTKTGQEGFLRILNLRGPLFLAKQIHGNAVVRAGLPGPVRPEADGIILSVNDPVHPVPVIGVIVADCVPVLLSDRQGTCIAAVHAGWKGTVLGVVAEAVRRMKESGVRPSDIFACIGPRIGPCCYTVGEDRVKLFSEQFGSNPRICYSTQGQWYADIGYANRVQLERSGVPTEQIDAVPMCTSCQRNLFYSFRKDTKETFGEIAAVIALRSTRL
jgi:YfiH family protein